MRRFIVILLTLISIQAFSQVKEIDQNQFEKLGLNKLLIYFENGKFFDERYQHRTSVIKNRFNLIELDTTTFRLHIRGQVYSNNNPDNDLTADINVGEIVSEDSKETKMKFTHYFKTDKRGNYDISFIVNNENSLLSFNTHQSFPDLIIMMYSDIYQVGKFLK